MATVNQAFPSAPMGRRMIFMLVGLGVMLLGVAAINLVIVFKVLPSSTPQAARIMVPLAPLGALVVVLPVFFLERARTSQFRIEENCLVLARKRFPLKGLVSVDRDPEILKRAVRIMGNGGLGSIRGRYWSKRVGKFYAFMTDSDHAVVLRWPDKVVAVSPADTEFFIYSARAAAGLR